MIETPRMNVQFVLLLAVGLVVAMSLAATRSMSPHEVRAAPVDVATSRAGPIVVHRCGSLCWRDAVAQDIGAKDTGPISG
jgi:hypothetical protein